ncbi:MAG: DinB family protein [Gemmatimonadaceae bacterium]
MPQTVLIRPAAGDYAEYYSNYIRLVPDGDLLDIMRTQIPTLHALLEPIGDEGAASTYAPGKWTVREVVGHLTDTERVFSYRAISFSRGDPNPLPSFDQAAWNPFGQYNDRSLADLLDEWTDTRRSSLALVRSMPVDALERRGVASGNEINVLSCICILAGHVNYHLGHLREHYRIGI